MNRRSFLQGALVSIGALGLLSSIATAEERRRGGGAAAAGAGVVQFVDPKDAAAKAVSYVENNSQIKDKALQQERNGVKFKDQRCMGCNFYDNTKEASAGGKKGAPCQMPFAGGKCVVEKGWCTSWAKKA